MTPFSKNERKEVSVEVLKFLIFNDLFFSGGGSKKKKSDDEDKGMAVVGLLLAAIIGLAILYRVAIILPIKIVSDVVNKILDNSNVLHVLLIVLAVAGAITLIRTINQAFLRKLEAEVKQLQTETKRKAD